MKTFEVQRYERGSWVHDSYLESPDLAVAQARQMAESGRYNGVRVIQDEFVEGKETSNATFLFVSKPRFVRAEAAPAAAEESVPPPPGAPDRLRTAPRSPGEGRRPTRSLLGILITLVLLIALGGAALYGLRAIFDYS